LGFVFRRNAKELLYFNLFSILIALRTLSIGTPFIMQVFPGLWFEAGSRLATALIPLFYDYFTVLPDRDGSQFP